MAKLKWTVEFEVDEMCIKDGFDLTDTVVWNMIFDEIGFLYFDGVDAKVIQAPDPELIKKLRGE